MVLINGLEWFLCGLLTVFKRFFKWSAKWFLLGLFMVVFV